MLKTPALKLSKVSGDKIWHKTGRTIIAMAVATNRSVVPMLMLTMFQFVMGLIVQAAR